MLWAASSIPHWGNVCPTGIAHATALDPHSSPALRATEHG